MTSKTNCYRKVRPTRQGKFDSNVFFFSKKKIKILFLWDFFWKSDQVEKRVLKIDQV